MDECDRLLAEVDMRRDVQTIFMATPHEKQVMMYSATLDKEVRPICRKFCQDPMEIFVDDDTKLTLHGLQQYYIRLDEAAKNRYGCIVVVILSLGCSIISVAFIIFKSSFFTYATYLADLHP